MAIILFDQYTHELSGDEIIAAEIIAARLRQNVGKDKVRTNKFISGILKHEYGLSITGARMRKIINWIRTKGLIPNLIASSAGYYVSNDPEEIDKYVFSLKQRAHAILHVAQVMQDYNNQTKLKTA